MAGIDDILAGTGGNTRADFSAIGDLPKAYWEGKDQKAKNDLRDAFKDGLPMKGDQVDWPAVTQKFFSVGAVDQGISAAGQAMTQQKMEYGQKSAADAFPGGQAPAQAPIVTPPSASAPRLKEVAAPLNKGGVQGQSGDQPGSIMGHIAAAGIPDELAGPYIAQFSSMAKTDPNATLSPEMSQRVQQVAQAAAQRMKGGQQPQPSGLTPQQPAQVAQAPQGQPQMQAPQQAPPDFNQRFNAARLGSDPTLGGLVPAGRTPQQQIGLLSRQIRDGMLTPEAAKVNQSHIDAITKAIEPTPDQKNAAASGLSVQDYQSQGDERAAQLTILKETVLPELNASKTEAKSARTEIQSLHKAREQLDAPGGIFTGTGAQIKLKLAKAAELFGVPNTDKITNSEAFVSAMGAKVVASLKALGVNPSNKDLIFAEKIAGNPELNETSLRRIIDIGEQAARDKINRHNSTVGEYTESNEAVKPYAKALRIEAPGQYQRPKSQPASAGGAKPSGSSPTFGSKADLHAAIASGALNKGDSFIGGDGVERTVP